MRRCCVTRASTSREEGSGRAIVSRRCERDWSESTITGTWYFSAALKASTMMWKQSSTDVGAITTRGASPCPA